MNIVRARTVTVFFYRGFPFAQALYPAQEARCSFMTRNITAALWM